MTDNKTDTLDSGDLVWIAFLKRDTARRVRVKDPTWIGARMAGAQRLARGDFRQVGAVLPCPGETANQAVERAARGLV